jgi:hypothetical protein
MTGDNGRDGGKRSSSDQAPRPAGGRLSLTEIAHLMNQATGSDELPRALAELEVRSPAWRRGMRKLRQLSRDCLHPDYDVVLSETREAPELWGQLAALSYAQQLVAVEDEDRYQTWGLCRLLQCRSAEIAASDAAGAARLANLALRIPRHLGETRYDADFVKDLQALGWCYLGNAWRELGEVHSAGDAFDLAETLRRTATGYLTFEADTLALLALLRRDQRRLGDAVAVVDRVEAIYGAADDEEVKVTEPELYDRARLAEARVDLAAGERGVAEQALRTAALGLLELDLGFDASLAYFDLAALHVGAGELDKVRKIGDDVMPAFSSRKVHREAMAALLLFQQACWDPERLAPGLLIQLAALIERERRPALGWWAGAKTLPFTARRGTDAGSSGTG